LMQKRMRDVFVEDGGVERVGRANEKAVDLGIGDEVFNPTRHEASIELDRQTTLPAPAPIPGDGDLGVIQIDSDPDAGDGYQGSIRL